jgi:CTP:molybdopterin cytidylyltransferase MocA
LERVDPGSFSVLIDPEWADGESSSLQAGLDYLQQEDVVDAVLLVSGDMPLIPSGTADQLLAAHATGSQPAVVPKYRYARGRPIVVGSELWPLLLGIDGDTSVEAVLATHASMVSEVWIDHLPPPVIGTPDDLEKWAPRR